LAAAVVLLTSVWIVPRAQIAFLRNASDLTADRRQELEDKARSTFAQAIAGPVFLVTAYLSWFGIDNANKQADLTRQTTDQQNVKTQDIANQQVALTTSGQISDRLSKAIDALSESNDATGKRAIVKHLLGIYALEGIVNQSPDNTASVVDILTAFVRNERPRHDATSGKLITYADKVPIPDDAQAALTVLGRITMKPDFRKEHPLYLVDTDLHGARLFNADFSRADLRAVNLQGACLGGINLNNATVQEADLSGVNFVAYRRIGKSDFTGLNLSKTKLTNADLSAQDLSQVANLTQSQIDTIAKSDFLTQLPKALSRPIHLGAKIPINGARHHR